MHRAVLWVAVGLSLVATSEATIHKVYNLHIHSDNQIKQHVNDTQPIPEYCNWLDKNGTNLDEETFVPGNVTTENGKGFCVLMVRKFQMHDNGRLVMLKYRGHVYGIQIFEGPDPNRYLFIFLLIVMHVSLLCFLISFAVSYRTYRRRSGQIKLLMMPS